MLAYMLLVAAGRRMSMAESGTGRSKTNARARARDSNRTHRGGLAAPCAAGACCAMAGPLAPKLVRKDSDLEGIAGGEESETESLLLDDAQPGSHGRAAGLRARRSGGGGGDGSLAIAAAKWAEEEEGHSNPTVDGELPLRALAQGLSMLSLDELRRLHLPTFPWQTGADGSPSLIESLRKKPWKAHYTTALGFVLSSRACPRCGRPAVLT